MSWIGIQKGEYIDVIYRYDISHFLYSNSACYTTAEALILVAVLFSIDIQSCAHLLPCHFILQSYQCIGLVC